MAHISVLSILGLLLLSTGCLSPSALPSMPVLPKWDTLPRGPVAQVMTLWADGVVVQADPMRNGRPTPGFAARVYLFGQELGEPFVADGGSLLVYLYDDLQPKTDPQGLAELQREVWIIDPASLNKVLKKDGLGWGYNLWLPWSNYHPDIRRVTLVACYRPEQGVEAWSGQHILALGGIGSTTGATASGPKKPSSLQTKTGQTTARNDVTLATERQ